jgi:AcrR family transcriptional regulator
MGVFLGDFPPQALPGRDRARLYISSTPYRQVRAPPLGNPASRDYRGQTMSPEVEDESRKALLKAGERLCSESGGAGRLALPALVQAAGVSEEAFRRLFADLDGFRRGLLQHMMDVVRSEVLAEAAVLERPGFERLWRTVEAFLDVNLRHPAMRRLAYELRTDPVAIELLRQRTGGYAMVFRTELATLDRPNPAGAARLATAMVVEAAKAESEVSHAQPEIRRALYAFLKGYAG